MIKRVYFISERERLPAAANSQFHVSLIDEHQYPMASLFSPSNGWLPVVMLVVMLVVDPWLQLTKSMVAVDGARRKPRPAFRGGVQTQYSQHEM